MKKGYERDGRQGWGRGKEEHEGKGKKERKDIAGGGGQGSSVECWSLVMVGRFFALAWLGLDWIGLDWIGPRFYFMSSSLVFLRHS